MSTSELLDLGLLFDAIGAVVSHRVKQALGEVPSDAVPGDPVAAQLDRMLRRRAEFLALLEREGVMPASRGLVGVLSGGGAP